MEKKSEIIQETVFYEPESLFLFHNNYGAEGYPNHWHNAVEIIMPIRLDYNIEVNRHIYNLKPDDILVIPSGELHQIYEQKTKGHRIILQFSLEILNNIRGFINASYAYSKIWLITSDNDPQLHGAIKTLLLEMLEEYLNRHDFFEVAVTNKIIGVSLHLIRRYQHNISARQESLTKRKLTVERLNECLDYINRNYNSKLTLESVAQAIGFSKFHFSRWFQENVNMSFHDYLSKIRIDKSEVMLQNSTLSVTEIAMESGFQSTNTFNRMFKKYNNCTPTEYRYLNYIKKQTSGTGSDDEEINDFVIQAETPAPNGVPGFDPAIAAGYATVSGIPVNPVIRADVPDPDVICVDGIYYMTSTTMYFNPGIPVMKSYDLIDWKLVGYVYDILDDSDSNALRNGQNAYGKGSWASSLRYHNGIYYVVTAALNTQKTYIFQTADIEKGFWDRYEIDGFYHDSSLLFDDDGKVYLIYGSGTIRIIELNTDATAIKEGAAGQVLIEDANAILGGGKDNGLPGEGAHFYKICGRYYIFLIAWPKTGTQRRIELCYRADSIKGPYEGRVVLDDDLGDNNRGVAQGGLVDSSPDVQYAVLFQDHGAVGRIPVLVPVTWEDGWPVFGVNGKVPYKLFQPGSKCRNNNTGEKMPIVCSDEFYPHTTYDYRAQNTSEYRHGFINSINQTKEPIEEKQLILNGSFDEDTKYWGVMEVADILMGGDELYNNAPVLYVTGRATTASGPKQIITGKVRPGGIYETHACVMYRTGPSSKIFNICLRSGTSWEGTRIIATGRLIKGKWGIIHGTYTLPEDADLNETSVFIETPYSDKPTRERDLMDFYVSFVSVTEKEVPVRTHTTEGENEPSDACLALPWQWNHNPDHNLWSLTDRPGYLRLKCAYINKNLMDARNTLTQRTFMPVCSAVTALETGAMKDGDTAGLAALQEIYGYVGVKVTNGEKFIIMVNAAAGKTHEEMLPPHALAGVQSSVPLAQDRVYLRVDFIFDSEYARFYYSLDEINWYSIGETLQMEYRLSHFTGYRFALFCFATQLTGGYADFDYFRLSDKTILHNENLKVLNASLCGDTVAPGIENSEICVSLCLDAPPEGNLYLSFPIPEILDVADVIFCDENICGSAQYEIKNRQLLITVCNPTDCSFKHNTSDKLADISFRINRRVTEDVTLILRPDYIYVPDSEAVYCVHNTYMSLEILSLDEKRSGYGGYYAADITGGDWFTVTDVDFGGNHDTRRLYFYAQTKSENNGELEVRLDSLAGEVIKTMKCGPGCDNWEIRSHTDAEITGVHTIYFIVKNGYVINNFRLNYWKI